MKSGLRAKADHPNKSRVPRGCQPCSPRPAACVRPSLTCSRHLPCGSRRAIVRAWAPGLPPTGKTELTPRDSILLLTKFPVRLDQRFAIDPCRTLRPSASRAWTVTWLEPRTPHQPGKLQKRSKNDALVLLRGFKSIALCCEISLVFSIECSSSTSPCQKMVQCCLSRSREMCAWRVLSRRLASEEGAVHAGRRQMQSGKGGKNREDIDELLT